MTASMWGISSSESQIQGLQHLKASKSRLHSDMKRRLCTKDLYLAMRQATFTRYGRDRD
jgi:hypothetical protein